MAGDDEPEERLKFEGLLARAGWSIARWGPRWVCGECMSHRHWRHCEVESADGPW